MTSPIAFNPAAVPATTLAKHLANGDLTSVDIVTTYLRQIEQHNEYLRGLISVAPRAQVLRVAVERDVERARGAVRGPLHGLPIVLKDVIMTGEEMGMPTTAGAWALREAVAKENAAVVERLVQKGMIILGKANLTEFCGHKYSNNCLKRLGHDLADVERAPYKLNDRGTLDLVPGWSAVGGQTQSPYVEGGLVDGELILGNSSPGGSSSGSAVSVAAGFAPFALGTECVGSVVTPANRAGLYAITLSKNRVPTDGVILLSSSFDRIGVMAKTASDLELLVDATIDESGREDSSLGHERSSWEGLSIGFADPTIWGISGEICRIEEGSDLQMKREYESAVAKIGKLGAKVVYPVELPRPSVLTYEGRSAFELCAFNEFPKGLEGSIERLKNSPVKNLAELIDFNEKNAGNALPEPYTSQSNLIRSLKEVSSEETLEKARKHLADHAGLDELMDKYGVDIIATPADSSLCSLAAAVGYPIGLVPLGVLDFNGRPFGLNFVVKANQEALMLRFMRAYEGSFPERTVPRMMRSD